MAKPIPKALVRAVLNRDSEMCQCCSMYCGNVIPHHIVFGGTGRKRIHIKENLITLCLECHRKAHSGKKMREWTYAWSREKYGHTVDRLLAEKWSDKK